MYTVSPSSTIWTTKSIYRFVDIRQPLFLRTQEIRAQGWSTKSRRGQVVGILHTFESICPLCNARLVEEGDGQEQSGLLVWRRSADAGGKSPF